MENGSIRTTSITNISKKTYEVESQKIINKQSYSNNNIENKTEEGLTSEYKKELINNKKHEQGKKFKINKRILRTVSIIVLLLIFGIILLIINIKNNKKLNNMLDDFDKF